MVPPRFSAFSEYQWWIKNVSALAGHISNANPQDVLEQFTKKHLASQPTGCVSLLVQQ